jgi:adenylylsulfate kinase-like enzyme
MKAAVVWLTGVPGSGKTTVARLLRDELTSRDVSTLLLDHDNPTSEDDAFYASIAEVARLAFLSGSVVILAATAPKRVHRDRVRASVGSFVEVLLIREHELGEDDPPYEDPEGPELIFDTDGLAATEISMAILRMLEKRSE